MKRIEDYSIAKNISVYAICTTKSKKLVGKIVCTLIGDYWIAEVTTFSDGKRFLYPEVTQAKSHYLKYAIEGCRFKGNKLNDPKYGCWKVKLESMGYSHYVLL